MHFRLDRFLSLTVAGGASHELQTLLDFIRAGDVLVVVKADRLGRSTRDVLNIVHELETKGASLRVLDPAIDTATPDAPRKGGGSPAIGLTHWSGH